MFILFQKIWVFLIVDVFLIFILFQIARQKMEEAKSEERGREKEIIKQRGATICYHFIDKNGKNQEGEINFYPYTFGRSQKCDVVIREEPKNGKYYLSREFITIMAINQEFRVIRCQRKDQKNQKFLSGRSDGCAFAGETSIKFRETLEINVTQNIMIYLEKKELNTSSLFKRRK